MKKYWITIDNWNLIETFTTESLSPHNFYLSRSFGNDLERFINKDGELFNNLILYEVEPVSDYAIEISEELLDTSLLIPINGKIKTKNRKRAESVFIYPRTIYFQKGKVRFRFATEKMKIAFIAESKIIFEVKCVEKYFDSFYINNTATFKPTTYIDDSLSFEYDKYMKFDFHYNFIKGAILGYARGKVTSNSIEKQNLILTIVDLKNSFAGLNTTIMMGEKPIQDVPFFIHKISQCKKIFYEQQTEKTNLFDITKQIFLEVIALTNKRAEELKKQNSPSYKRDLDIFKKKQEKIRNKLDKIESKFNITETKIELESIKAKEVENGKALGQNRKYFKNNTVEYQKKQKLKQIIKQFKNENSEYQALKSELKEIEEKLSDYRFGYTEYDSTISTLFTRLSDNVNDLLKKVKIFSNENISLDLSVFSISNGILKITPNVGNEAEIRYFNILLNHVLKYSIDKNNIISDVALLNIIAETGKIFSAENISKTEEGKCIINTLREYWKYKNQKADIFEIPPNYPLLQSIMAFFIKARGFDQIERFMLNKGYPNKEFAFLLWAGTIGFASLPKTFTNIIYSKEYSHFEYQTEEYLRIIRYENII